MWNWRIFRLQKLCLQKTLIAKLVKECTSIIEENKICNKTSMISSNYSASCTVYIVLFVVFLLLCLLTSSVFIYFYWYERSNTEKISVHIRFNPNTQLNY